MKYPLTDEAKQWAVRLVEAWKNGDISQYIEIDYDYEIGEEGLAGSAVTGINFPFKLPGNNVFLELANFNLLNLNINWMSAGGSYYPRYSVLLMQELFNAVESDFEVSEYFLTINAVGTIIQDGAVVTAPFQSAAVGYGSLSQTQTVKNSELADKLIQMLGPQFLESNREIVAAINEFRESIESDRQSKLGKVISQLGNSLQHGANAFVVYQALMYLTPFISQIVN
jgi:hypothetical protein